MFSRSFTIGAIAADDKGVSRVDFYVDREKVASDTKFPYAYAYRAPRSLALGSHTVVAVAYDAQGLAGVHWVSVTRTSERRAAKRRHRSVGFAVKSAAVTTLAAPGPSSSATKWLTGKVQGATDGVVQVALSRYDARRARWVTPKRTSAVVKGGRFQARAHLRRGRYQAVALFRDGERGLRSRSKSIRFNG